MRLYIGRRDPGHYYELGTVKKHFENDGFADESWIYSFCADTFEEITGIKLAPGEIRKVKSITIELEE